MAEILKENPEHSGGNTDNLFLKIFHIKIWLDTTDILNDLVTKGFFFYNY